MFLRIIPEPSRTDPAAPYYELLLEWIVWFIRRHGWNAYWTYDETQQASIITADVSPLSEMHLLHRLAVIPTVSHSLLKKGIHEVYVRSYDLPIELTGTLVHAPESIGEVHLPIPADTLDAAARLARQGFSIMGFMVYEGRFIIIVL